LVGNLKGGKPCLPQLHQGFSTVVEVFFKDSEVTALMPTLPDKGSLLAWSSDAKSVEGFIEGINPLSPNVEFFQLLTCYHDFAPYNGATARCVNTEPLLLKPLHKGATA
jgi:hypothetical protein